MDSNDIINHIMITPANTNPNILRSQFDERDKPIWDNIGQLNDDIADINEEIGTDETEGSILGRISALENSGWREATEADYTTYQISFMSAFNTSAKIFINESAGLIAGFNNANIEATKPTSGNYTYQFIRNNKTGGRAIVANAIMTVQNVDLTSNTYAAPVFESLTNENSVAQIVFDASLMNDQASGLKNYLRINFIAVL